MRLRGAFSLLVLFSCALTCSSPIPLPHPLSITRNRAYQKLWDDAKDYASFWSILADELGSEPAVIGGELWNEPFPGAVFDNATYRQNHVADLENLQPFYEKVTKSIRGEES